MNLASAIELLSYDFISMDKLINFFGKLIILARNNVNVIIHRIYFSLHVGVVFMERLIRIASAFEFLAQVHQLVFSLSNFDL